MPSPERGGTGHDPEQEQPERYYKASRFPGEEPAGRAYFKTQDTIFEAREKADLSCYRFQLDTVYHVAVLGERPHAKLERKLERILASGEAVELPEDILDVLWRRRELARQINPWVEGHYRPGKRI